MNGRIEHVKKVGKQVKKACPVELKLAHGCTALAQALGFADWYQLTKSLSDEFSGVFRTRVLAISPDPSNPTFLAAVKRFADSCGIDLATAHTLCVELLPQALEKWPTWNDRRPDTKESPKIDAEILDSPHQQKGGRRERAEIQPLFAATAGHEGGRLIPQRQHNPVVVLKKRRTF